MNRKFLVPKKVGVRDQWRGIQLAKPSITLKWAQWFWSEEALLPAHSLMFPQKSSRRNAQVLLALSRGLGSQARKMVWPRRNGLYWYVWPDQSLVIQEEVEVHDLGHLMRMWQMALRKKQKKVWIVHMGALPRELILWTRTVRWPKQWWGWPVSDVRGKGPFPARCFLWL